MFYLYRVLLAQFSQHINSNFPFLKNKKLLVTISGGIDSVVLTHLLCQLKFDISLAHCNFHLRGQDSIKDENFVKELAEQLSMPVFIRSFATIEFAKKEKLSVQMAARKLRYNWFNLILEENELDYILTAHHADDNLETFIINTIRGTGLEGLTGIPDKNQNILRLLLPFSREQIEDYAKENSLIWREDSSNIEIKYVRNKIRHQVIPVLKELNPSLLNSFNKTLQNLKSSRHIIDDTIEKIKQKIVIPLDSSDDEVESGIDRINIEKLKVFNDPKAYLYEILKGYGFTEWNDVADLMDAQSGKQIFSATHRLVKDRDFLLLTKQYPEDAEEISYTLDEKIDIFEKDDLKLQFTKSNPPYPNRKNQNIVFIDKDKLKFPIVVRKWRKGDFFYPSGMQGKKKLSKFFIEKKMSILQKEKIWLLCSADKIVWVIGERLDERFKVTDSTKNILKIEYL